MTGEQEGSDVGPPLWCVSAELLSERQRGASSILTFPISSHVTLGKPLNSSIFQVPHL